MITARRAVALPAALLALCCGPGALAQDAITTDADLHAAYCIPVLNWVIRSSRESQAALDDYRQQSPSSPERQAEIARQAEQLRKLIAGLESTLGRLQAYLHPRIEHRDPEQLAQATDRGEADLRELRVMSDRCTKACAAPALNGAAGDRDHACLDDCKDRALTERLRACTDATWLP